MWLSWLSSTFSSVLRLLRTRVLKNKQTFPCLMSNIVLHTKRTLWISSERVLSVLKWRKIVLKVLLNLFCSVSTTYGRTSQIYSHSVPSWICHKTRVDHCGANYRKTHVINFTQIMISCVLSIIICELIFE